MSAENCVVGQALQSLCKGVTSILGGKLQQPHSSHPFLFFVKPNFMNGRQSNPTPAVEECRSDKVWLLQPLATVTGYSEDGDVHLLPLSQGSSLQWDCSILCQLLC